MAGGRLVTCVVVASPGLAREKLPLVLRHFDASRKCVRDVFRKASVKPGRGWALGLEAAAGAGSPSLVLLDALDEPLLQALERLAPQLLVAGDDAEPLLTLSFVRVEDPRHLLPPSSSPAASPPLSDADSSSTSASTASLDSSSTSSLLADAASSASSRGGASLSSLSLTPPPPTTTTTTLLEPAKPRVVRPLLTIVEPRRVVETSSLPPSSSSSSLYPTLETPGSPASLADETLERARAIDFALELATIEAAESARLAELERVRQLSALLDSQRQLRASARAAFQLSASERRRHSQPPALAAPPPLPARSSLNYSAQPVLAPSDASSRSLSSLSLSAASPASQRHRSPLPPPPAAALSTAHARSHSQPHGLRLATSSSSSSSAPPHSRPPALPARTHAAPPLPPPPSSASHEDERALSELVPAAPLDSIRAALLRAKNDVGAAADLLLKAFGHGPKSGAHSTRFLYDSHAVRPETYAVVDAAKKQQQSASAKPHATLGSAAAKSSKKKDVKKS